MDDATSHRSYPLPHPDNMLDEDVLRLRDALSQIDADVAQQQTATTNMATDFLQKLNRQRLRAFHQFGF